MPAKRSTRSPQVSPAWTAALAGAADPGRSRHYLEQMLAGAAAETVRAASTTEALILTALFSGSQALSEALVRHPDWLVPHLAVEHLRHSRQEQGLRREIHAWLEPRLRARDYAGALAQLRQFKQREMLRIAARDLARLGETPEIVREISDVADGCLTAVGRICRQHLQERMGQPFHQDAASAWRPTPFAVLGLGKLGGQELNYSSDVDVIFVYSEEGHVFKERPDRTTKAPARGLNSHEFFKRLAEMFIAEVSRSTGDGMLYRIDLRLRPEGDQGPLARSLASYENYYAQWGQTWERMMLLKARGVAGDAELAAEFIEMIHPFRYPRRLNEGVLREIAAMKDRIEQEIVRAGDLDRNVKLGHGGIREIEFVAQSLQLIHAGRIPFLQGAQTLPTLQKLVQYGLLEAEAERHLAAAYTFLRDVEHRLQMENNLQTHTLPREAAERQRLAALMGFRARAAFEKSLRGHQGRVRGVYERLFHREEGDGKPDLPDTFAGAEGRWKEVLAGHGFRDLDRSYRRLHEFAHGPGYVHVSPRTTELASQLIPRLLALCPNSAREANSEPGTRNPEPETRNSEPETRNSEPETQNRILSDPDRVLARLDSYVTAYGARATMFETWAANPQLFELLLLLFDRSEFLAERAIRTPDLVDDLVLSGRLNRQKSAEEILRDLEHGRDDPDQHVWLRRYFQAEQMRLGLRDILGLAEFDQNLAELSALADACLRYALAVVLRKHRCKTVPLAVIGLGKLGGGEVTYGSDLDLLFVARAGTRDLPRWQRIAADVMDLLSRRTGDGLVFVTDARLRPDGEKGLLVNTLDGFEEYYRRRAALWEIQALTRTRFVAGESGVGHQFEELAGALTNFRPNAVAAGFPGRRSGAAGARGRSPTRALTGLAAWSRDWREKIAHMRRRIEVERTPAGQAELALKTSAGGLIDAEFIAQTFCLAHGWQEANTQRALERARDAGALPRAEAEGLLENYRHLRRIEGILRRWSFEGETELPVDPAPFRRVSIRCGFVDPEDFRAAVAGYRRAIRAVYQHVMPAHRP